MKINYYLTSFFIVLFCVSGIKTRAQNKNEDIIDLSAFNNSLASIEIYSKNINVKKLEAFDLDQKGNIYYARLGLVENGKGHKVYLYKAKPNEPPEDYMTLKYFGHPYNISVEENQGDTFIWISSNGSKHKNGKYWDEPSVSRIEYIPGKTYAKGYGGSTYFLNRDSLQKTQVDINREHNKMVVAAESKKGNNWSFFTYNLEEVEALSDTLFNVRVTIGGEDNNEEKTFEKEVQGRDLSKLTPLGFFTLTGKRRDKPDALNSFWMQGFNIDDNNTIYFYEGEGNRQGRNAQAYITALDIDGRVIGERTKIKATESQSDLNKANIRHASGNLEPEGMTIRDGAVYLGFLSKDGDKRQSNILKYKK